MKESISLFLFKSISESLTRLSLTKGKNTLMNIIIDKNYRLKEQSIFQAFGGFLFLWRSIFYTRK